MTSGATRLFKGDGQPNRASPEKTMARPGTARSCLSMSQCTSRGEFPELSELSSGDRGGGRTRAARVEIAADSGKKKLTHAAGDPCGAGRQSDVIQQALPEDRLHGDRDVSSYPHTQALLRADDLRNTTASSTVSLCLRSLRSDRKCCWLAVSLNLEPSAALMTGCPPSRWTVAI